MKLPRLAEVVRFVQTAVIAQQNVVLVERIKRHRVMIHMHTPTFPVRVRPRRAAIRAARKVGTDLVHVTDTMRIEKQLAVVLTRATGKPVFTSCRDACTISGGHGRSPCTTPTTTATASSARDLCILTNAHPRGTVIG